jgi:hypothetical protein
MDSHRIHYALARHYGRKCRLVFPHGDWPQHEASIASGWKYMAHELPWEEARAAVLAGWEAMGFDGRDALFHLPADNDDEDDAADVLSDRREPRSHS